MGHASGIGGGAVTPRLSVVYATYRNPLMLARQLALWSDEWPDSMKYLVEVVIVDDASPEPAIDVIRAHGRPLPHIQLLRVKEDRPWAHLAARNIGAHEARGRWLLCSDIDHALPADTLAACLSLDDEGAAYFFGRRDAEPGWRADDWPLMPVTVGRTGAPKGHPNSFCLTREMFWRAGGHCESYVGVYGTDSLFRERLFKHARRVDLPLPLIRVGRDVISDASTVGLPRKTEEMRDARAAIKAAKAARGESDVVKVLQFEWERVL